MKTISSTSLLLAALLIGTSLSTFSYAQSAGTGAARVDAQGRAVTSSGVVLKNADGTMKTNPERTVPGVNLGNSLTKGTLQADIDAGYNPAGTVNSAQQRASGVTGAIINNGVTADTTTQTGSRPVEGSTNGTTSNINGVRTNRPVMYGTVSNQAGQRVVEPSATGAMDGANSVTRSNTDINAGVTGAVINDGVNSNNVVPSAGTGSATLDTNANADINTTGSTPDVSAGGAFGGGSTGAVSGGALGSSSSTSGSTGASGTAGGAASVGSSSGSTGGAMGGSSSGSAGASGGASGGK